LFFKAFVFNKEFDPVFVVLAVRKVLGDELGHKGAHIFNHFIVAIVRVSQRPSTVNDMSKRLPLTFGLTLFFGFKLVHFEEEELVLEFLFYRQPIRFAIH
jgi:hypothetical protein